MSDQLQLVSSGFIRLSRDLVSKIANSTSPQPRSRSGSIQKGRWSRDPIFITWHKPRLSETGEDNPCLVTIIHNSKSFTFVINLHDNPNKFIIANCDIADTTDTNTIAGTTKLRTFTWPHLTLIVQNVWTINCLST